MRENAPPFNRNGGALVLVRTVTADKVLSGSKVKCGTVLKTSLDYTEEAALQVALRRSRATVPARR